METTLSGTLQDYLKAIYCLEKEAGGVSRLCLPGHWGFPFPR